MFCNLRNYYFYSLTALALITFYFLMKFLSTSEFRYLFATLRYQIHHYITIYDAFYT